MAYSLSKKSFISKGVLGVLILLILLGLLNLLLVPTQTPIESKQSGGADKKLSGWHQDATCQYEMIKVLKTFIKANHLNNNTEDNWELYIPCGYNDAEAEYERVTSSSKYDGQKIFIIKGCDNLSRKDTLWEHLTRRYGREAVKLMPQTYILYKDDDIQRLSENYSMDRVYIMKKNIQRQEGLKITKSKSELLGGAHDGFVVAQEMLQDPYVIDGRKTNCRCYLLVMCRDGVKTGYVFTNGFMYYTPMSFQKNSMEYDRVITAGLATPRRDNEFYKNHPLTLQQFQKHLERTGYKGDIFATIGILFENVLNATAGAICEGAVPGRTTFQLFGCDVAFNEHLSAQLMEINKGPDLTSKTTEEEELKDKLMQHIFYTVGMIKEPLADPKEAIKTEMRKIWSYE